MAFAASGGCSSHGVGFGLWRDRPEGSLELQRALRQEWGAP
jgi:hypothetical protein